MILPKSLLVLYFHDSRNIVKGYSPDVFAETIG